MSFVRGLSLPLRTFLTFLAVWTCLAAAEATLSIGLGNGRNRWVAIVSLYAAHSVSWALLTVAIRRWSQLAARSSSRMVTIAMHVAFALAAAVADAYVRRTVSALFLGPSSVGILRTMLYFADVTALRYILALWLGKAAETRDALVAQAKRELALRSEMARARLNYLNAQLQPHFLFNALGAVSELIFENPAKALRIFRQLGSVLRTASSQGAGEIKLRDEIAGLLPFLEIQRTRFSDWLTIALAIDDDVQDVFVPPFVLQPLVENAIRHGLLHRASRGEVSIKASRSGDKLVLAVRDDGIGLLESSSKGRGLGLSNTAERLRTLYGDEAMLRLHRDETGGTVAEVSIPARSISSVQAPIALAGDALATQASPASFARRHPAVALVAGIAAAALLWSQQSYSYLVMTERLGERTLIDLIRNDFIMVALWGLLVPIIVWIARRVPVSGPRSMVNAFVHFAAAIVLGLAHAAVVFFSRPEQPGSTLVGTFRGSAVITMLVYAGVLAYSQRRVLEEWLAERQLSALRLNAEIAESNVAAAAMSVSPERLDFALADLERHVWNDPLIAEQVIANLGTELRETLDSSLSHRDMHSSLFASYSIAGEDRIERFAMGA